MKSVGPSSMTEDRSCVRDIIAPLIELDLTNASRSDLCRKLLTFTLAAVAVGIPEKDLGGE